MGATAMAATAMAATVFRRAPSAGPCSAAGVSTCLGPLCNSSGVVLLQPSGGDQLGFGRQLDGPWSSARQCSLRALRSHKLHGQASPPHHESWTVPASLSAQIAVHGSCVVPPPLPPLPPLHPSQRFGNLHILYFNVKLCWRASSETVRGFILVVPPKYDTKTTESSWVAPPQRP